MNGGGRIENQGKEKMTNKKFTSTEILNYKRRALEIAEIFGDDLKQETTKLYIQYIESKKNDLFNNYLQAQRAKKEENDKQWKNSNNNTKIVDGVEVK